MKQARLIKKGEIKPATQPQAKPPAEKKPDSTPATTNPHKAFADLFRKTDEAKGGA